MREPAFVIVSVTPDCVLIKDVGSWDQHPSVTNAAERVVEIMLSQFRFEFPEGRRLEYIDSEGDRSQLVIKDGKFSGFAPAGFRHAPPVLTETLKGRLEGLRYALNLAKARRGVLNRPPGYLAAIDEMETFLAAAIERTEAGEEMHSTAVVSSPS